MSLEWVATSESADGGLTVLLRVIAWSEEMITGVVEHDWTLVPEAARSGPARVRNFLEALAEVLAEHPERLDAYWISSLDPLRRSGGRTQASFAAILRRQLESQQ